MPKIGMEPVRRAALIDATIAEIGDAGSLDVTVSAIARRAGMSSGLAHHYFGGKDQIFLASMRHIIATYGDEVKAALIKANTPIERAQGVVTASFAPANFRPEVVSAWLNFYVLAQSNPEAHRLLSIYQRRIVSNLSHALRPLIGEHAPMAAARLAAMIDGQYLREGLSGRVPNGPSAARQVCHQLQLEIGTQNG